MGETGADLGRSASERERLAAATVELVGELGYGEAQADAIARRAGLDPAAFASHFASTEDAFIAAWEPLGRAYLERVVEARRAEAGWRAGLRAALAETARCAVEDPRRARFLALEVMAAGERARAGRDLLMRSLAALVDEGRGELGERDSVPYSTAEGIVGALYSRLYTALRAGRQGELPAAVPELMCFAVMPYLGVEAALEELHRAGP